MLLVFIRFGGGAESIVFFTYAASWGLGTKNCTYLTVVDNG
jgi:hypothetical protein